MPTQTEHVESHGAVVPTRPVGATLAVARIRDAARAGTSPAPTACRTNPVGTARRDGHFSGTGSGTVNGVVTQRLDA